MLRAVSPSTLLRTVSLSNGLSNGSWTFYEAINNRRRIVINARGYDSDLTIEGLLRR